MPKKARPDATAEQLPTDAPNKNKRCPRRSTRDPPKKIPTEAILTPLKDATAEQLPTDAPNKNKRCPRRSTRDPPKKIPTEAILTPLKADVGGAFAATPVMNRDEGGYKLSHVWDSVLAAKAPPTSATYSGEMQYSSQKL
ncbi:hypothetical protein Bbelb_326940 [Branchiostoma belcheri]|nr:hypothetical protein Bbelb_326940 [Branchiostoma belcheri]